MKNAGLLRQEMNSLISRARNDIYTLATMDDTAAGRQILRGLWDTLSMINLVAELLANEAQANHTPMPPEANQLQSGTIPSPAQTPPSAATSAQTQQTPAPPIQTQVPPITPAPQVPTTQQTQRDFTVEELAAFNGKNGQPAYVAVNGIVYDVTNNRAWAAATHFALTAGKDYTQEFASCHAGMQSILATLPVVGRLV